MPNFCANCSTALDPDAKFCPSCSAPVSYAAALATELSLGFRSNVQEFVRSPAMRVPLPIWAGVIQLFWLPLNVAAGSLWTVAMFATQVASGVTGVFGQGQSMDGTMITAVLLVHYYLALLSFEVPLVFGFFGQKQWAYGLFFRGMCPLVFLMWLISLLVVVGRMLSGSNPPQGQSSSLSAVFFIILALVYAGLFILQIVLVHNSKGLLVR